MLNNLGSTELVVIVLVLIVLFGGSKIAGLARNLGETSKELKHVKKEYEDALAGKSPENETNEEEAENKEV